MISPLVIGRSFPQEIFQIGGAIRQNLNPKLKQKPSCPYLIKTIGIALASGETEYSGLLLFLNQILSLKNYNVIVRPHPSDPIKPILKNITLRLNYKIESDVPLDLFLESIDLILYASSTVCLEALYRGIPALQLKYGNFLNLDPLFMGSNLKWTIQNNYDFQNALKDITSMSVETYQLRLRETHKFITSYFSSFNTEFQNYK